MKDKKRDKNLIYLPYIYNFYLYYYYYNYRRLEGFLIRRGNKLKSKLIMLKLRGLVKKEARASYFVVFFFCFFNIYPVIGLRSVRLGGSKKEIPMVLTLKRRVFLVRRLLLKGVLNKKSINLNLLANVIVSTFKMKGRAVSELMDSYNTGVTNSYLLQLIK
jgi:ribosomal protein S7